MKSSFNQIFPQFALYIISILIISYLGLIFFPVSYIFNPTLPSVLSNWDGAYYLNIVQSGYSDSHHFAFLPLYPGLIYLLTFVTGNSLISGILISWSCFLLALIFLFRITQQEYSIKIAHTTLTYLLIFPTSFYFIVVYTESLFLMLAVLVFYFLQRQNKYDLIFATGVVSLSLITRIFGLGLLLALWITAFTNKDLKYRWVVLFGPLTLIGYIYYLQLTYQNPWLMISAQHNWDRTVGLSNLDIFSLIADLWSKPLTGKLIIQWLEYILLAFGLGLLIRVIRHQKLPYVIYSLTAFLIILISGSLQSVPRYLVVIFPLFIALATWKKRHSINLPWNKIYLTVSGSLLLLFLIRFINGYWVA